MSSSKYDQTKKRWLPGSAVVWLLTATALGACDDGPTYGEIPRFGGAGTGGKATSGKGGSGSGNAGNRGGTLNGASGENGEGGVGASAGDEGLAGDGTGAMSTGTGGTGSGTAGTGNGTAGTGNGTAGTAGTSNGAAGSSAGGSGGSVGTGGGGGTGGSKTVNLCGNGKIDEGETCDDGNKFSGDGCSSQCQCACEACEQSEACFKDGEDLNEYTGTSWFQSGYEMEGVATDGPAANIPRAELFRDALDCVRRTNCLKVVGNGGGAIITECVCLNPVEPSDNPVDLPAACFDEAKFIPGPCFSKLQDAAEANTLVELREHWASPTFAIGIIIQLLNRCDTGECRTECFTPEQSADWPNPQAESDNSWSCGNCNVENACVAP